MYCRFLYSILFIPEYFKFRTVIRAERVTVSRLASCDALFSAFSYFKFPSPFTIMASVPGSLTEIQDQTQTEHFPDNEVLEKPEDEQETYDGLAAALDSKVVDVHACRK